MSVIIDHLKVKIQERVIEDFKFLDSGSGIVYPFGEVYLGKNRTLELHPFDASVKVDNIKNAMKAYYLDELEKLYNSECGLSNFCSNRNDILEAIKNFELE